MNAIGLLMIPSIIAIVILPMIASRQWAARLSAFLATASFVFSIRLAIIVFLHHSTVTFLKQWFICDQLSLFFIMINTFITITAAFYSISYLNNESQQGVLHSTVYRFYHTFYHVFTFSMLLVLLSNNLGIMWVAMELATISSVVLVALYQTPRALEAAWKYLILCGVGIGFALMGTILFYFASHHSLSHYQGLLWSSLMPVAHLLPPKLLEVAFVFIFVGYGTKVGFVPLHNWLPDAHAEGPSPISALLSGLLLNVAFFAILRFKLILDQTAAHHFAQTLLLLFGFINLGFASFSLMRQRTIKRLFAYSSIEHMGLISIAFGIGTPLAYLAGFLHLFLHSLSKTAVFFSCGNIIQHFHTQTIKAIKGLFAKQPLLAGLFLLGCFSILGMPPSGLFLSELLLVFAVIQTNVWLAVLLVIGLSIAFIGILLRVQPMLFSTPEAITVKNVPQQRHMHWPIILHLTLVMLAGLWIPLFLIKPVIIFFTHGAL